MNVDITMPDLSTSGSTIRVSQWLIKPGQQIKQGQPMLEVETDKATMEVEAFLNGTLVEIVVPDDSEVEVGQVIAVMAVEGGSAEAATQAAAETPAVPQAAPETAAPAAQAPRPGGMFSRNRQKTAEPAPAAASASPSLSTIQRVVGQRMQSSKQTAPHFYLQTSANAAGILRRRSAAAEQKLAVDAFFVCAAAKALAKFDRLMFSFQENQLVQAPDAIGVAVDLEGDLFVVPIAQPATKTVEQISAEIRVWAGRLQAGEAEARRVHPTAFTISNLGATGVESFTAIINPPEAAILAVGKIAAVPVADEGQVVIQERVNLVLSIDHRVVNGRYAADFLQALVKELEDL